MTLLLSYHRRCVSGRVSIRGGVSVGVSVLEEVCQYRGGVSVLEEACQ